jgi:putative holliday junction resolvase
MKVMALDFGAARTGVAVSDPTGIIARPLCVIARAASANGLVELVRLVDDERPEQIVVGHPLTLRGERGEQARATENFAAALRERVDVPVLLFDERFTTDLAEQNPSSAPEDARAAAHLLSSYLAWSSAAPA